ncbi:MAG: hypothetical protein LC799_06630, partial [Actinobacteria bacterium]|nr:hypothetical protein [Actinomycetota bacterium]
VHGIPESPSQQWSPKRCHSYRQIPMASRSEADKASMIVPLPSPSLAATPGLLDIPCRRRCCVATRARGFVAAVVSAQGLPQFSFKGWER